MIPKQTMIIFHMVVIIVVFIKRTNDANDNVTSLTKITACFLLQIISRRNN